MLDVLRPHHSTSRNCRNSILVTDDPSLPRLFDLLWVSSRESLEVQYILRWRLDPQIAPRFVSLGEVALELVKNPISFLEGSVKKPIDVVGAPSTLNSNDSMFEGHVTQWRLIDNIADIQSDALHRSL